MRLSSLCVSICMLTGVSQVRNVTCAGMPKGQTSETGHIGLESVDKKTRVILVAEAVYDGQAYFSSHNTVWLGLGVHLQNLGHHVTVLLVAGPENNAHRLAATREVYQKHQLRTEELPSPQHAYSGAIEVQLAFRVFEFLHNHTNLDLVYFADWQGLGYYSVVGKSQGLGLQRTQLVAVLTGSRSWHAERANRQNLLASEAHLKVAFMERGSVARADAIASPSAAMLQAMQNLGWTLPNRSLVAPFLLPGWEEAERLLAVEGARRLPVTEVVFVGGLDRGSGVHVFCNAISRLLQSLDESSLKVLTLERVTFLGADGDMSFGPLVDGPIGGRHLGSEYVKARAIEWRKTLPNITLSLIHTLDAAQTTNFFRQGLGSRVAVLTSSSDPTGVAMTTLLLAKAPLFALYSDAAAEVIHAHHHSAALLPARSAELATALARVLDPAAQLAPPQPAPSKQHSQRSAAATWRAWHAGLADTWPRGECSSAAGAAAQNDERHTCRESGAEHNKAGSADADIAVTVVIVHHNRPKLLKQALDSLVNQTFPSFQFTVVVVDDGSSSEESTQFLDELEREGSDLRSRGWQVVRQRNHYLGAARNAGWRRARSKWVLFMDDDNVAMPDMVEAMVRAGELTGASVVTAANVFLPSAAEPPTASTVPHGAFIPLGGSAATGMFENSFGDANALVRTDILNASLSHAWAEDDDYGMQDWELFAKLVLAGHRLEVVPKALYWYRTNSKSMLRSSVSAVNNQLYLRPYLAQPLGIVGPYLSELHRTVHVQSNRLQETHQQLRESRRLMKLLRRLHCGSSINTHKQDSNQVPPSDLILNGAMDLWSVEPEAVGADQVDSSEPARFELLAPDWVERASAVATHWDAHISGYSYSLADRSYEMGLVKNNPGHGSIRVDLANNGMVGGAYQFVVVKQEAAAPLLLHGWSKVLEMSGFGAPIDYSLYADLYFEDGSQEWAFYAPFNPSTEGWQHAYGLIDHPKPVYGMSVVLLFRYRGGAVVFDEIQVVPLEQGICGMPEDIDGD